MTSSSEDLIFNFKVILFIYVLLSGFRSTLDHRISSRAQGLRKRNDLVEMMLEAMTGIEEQKTNHSRRDFDEITLTATAMVLLVAG